VGITLDEAEIRAFLEQSHTGILTTLRRDGFPVSLPTWFAALEGRIYLNTPSKTKKLTRIRNDPRASFLVESGLAWRELKAVMFYGRVAEFAEGEETLRAKVRALLDEKYRGFRTERRRQPDATRKHYSGGVMLCFEPEGEPISWDNSKLRMH
jgi:nitroimidazol reductase NimA-like FMN-containing flavoprotein (pyridoxamine 5'-phosphate oxidase superfamily)